MSKKIEVLSREVGLTIARYKAPERTDYLISNWMRNRNTLEFLGLWEQINNPAFNPIEFDGIKKDAVCEFGSLTRVFGFFRPNGAPQASPGQRPGNNVHVSIEANGPAQMPRPG